MKKQVYNFSSLLTLLGQHSHSESLNCHTKLIKTVDVQLRNQS